jgi:hypothetical protein
MIGSDRKDKSKANRPTKDWPDLIRRQHVQFLNGENKVFDKILKWYRGTAWSKEQIAYASSRGMALANFNLVFAIAETAISSIMPNNLKFSVTEIDDVDQYVAPKVEEDLNKLSRRGDWREEAIMALTHAILYGRFFFKVTLGSDGKPCLRATDPRKVMVDLTAERPKDIRYFVHTVPTTVEAFVGMVNRPDSPFKIPDSAQVGTPEQLERKLRELASGYPAWMDEEAARQAGDNFLILHEVYDVECQEVSYWIDGWSDPVLYLRGEEFYNPFVIGNLNYNGANTLGLSEIHLVMDNIEIINRFLSYLVEVARLQIPVTLYDKGAMDEKEINAVAQASPGDLIGITPGQGKTVHDMLGNPEVPKMPADIQIIMSKLESVISYVTALSDSARGQVTGARTATELALIEGQQRTRLASRIQRFHKALTDAAAHAILLMKAMPKDQLPEVMESISITAGSSAEMNRNVMAEKFQQMYAFISANKEGFDMERLREFFVEIFGMPKEILLAPAAPTNSNAPTEIPPEALAALQAQGIPEETA